MSIEAQAQARQEQAKSYGLPKKAEAITETLGEIYTSIYVYPESGLGGGGSDSKHGRRYKTRRFDIKYYKDQDKKQHTTIGFREKRRWWQWRAPYQEVYHEVDGEVSVFRNEDSWLTMIDQLNLKAIKTAKERVVTEEQRKVREREERFITRFGLGPS